MNRVEVTLKYTPKFPKLKKILVKTKDDCVSQNRTTKKWKNNINKNTIFELVDEYDSTNELNSKRVVTRILYDILADRNYNYTRYHDAIEEVANFFIEIEETDITTLKLLYDFDIYLPTPNINISSEDLKMPSKLIEEDD